MSIVLDFLNALDKDAVMLAEYKKDGKAVMTKYGLNEAEQRAILSQDKKQVADLLGISSDDVPILHTNGTY
jgi:hypothetical protein